MDFMLCILLILCFSPILILGLHIGIQRASRGFSWKLPAQIGAFMAIFGAFIPVAYVEWQSASDEMLLSSESVFGFLAYILIVYLMIGYLYISLLNLSDTSLHIHILMEIASSRELLLSSIEKEYNKDTLVDTKIDRLISLGLLRCEADRLYSGNKGYLYYGYLFDFWRWVMCMPTEPKMD